jgi:hypothetical protein
VCAIEKAVEKMDWALEENDEEEEECNMVCVPPKVCSFASSIQGVFERCYFCFIGMGMSTRDYLHF